MTKFEVIKFVYVQSDNQVDRLIFGERENTGKIPAEFKNIISQGVGLREEGYIFGTISFMDYMVHTGRFPRITEDNTERDWHFEEMKALSVLRAGVRTSERRKGNFEKMMGMAERFAKAENCQCVVLYLVENRNVIAWAKKRDYVFFDNSKHAIKYL